VLGRNHALSGAVGFLVAAPMATPDANLAQLAVGTVVCAAWALAPDLDHPGATVSRGLGPGGRVASAGVRVVSGGHRQGTHSILASVLVGVLAWWMTFHAPTHTVAAVTAGIGVMLAVPLLGKSVGVAVGGPVGLALGAGVGWALWAGHVAIGPWFFLAVTLGFALHWVGDALTPQGVPWLWPLHPHRLKIPLFTTGSPLEGVASMLFVAALAVLSWQTFSPALPFLT
jgi:membrane-bound metal-dependent hydrolase YbcI (DUF457 family)